MAYLVKSAFNPAKPLTAKQRLSPHFAEEPRIGPFTLRRGMSLTLTEGQMKQYDAQLKKLYLAEAITITALDESGKQVEVKPEEQATPTPPPAVSTEPFPSPEQIAQAVEQEQKAVEAEVERVVESLDAPQPTEEQKAAVERHSKRRKGKE